MAQDLTHFCVVWPNPQTELNTLTLNTQVKAKLLQNRLHLTFFVARLHSSWTSLLT